MECEIRRAASDEAPAISAVILAALRATNAKDYTPEIIERVASSFGPIALRDLMKHRTVLVAARKDRVVGTASLDGRAIRTMFVAPEVQGHGIGRRLVGAIEDLARTAGIEVLALASSITAERFYTKLGYRALREAFHGEERTIVMERTLQPLE